MATKRRATTGTKRNDITVAAPAQPGLGTQLRRLVNHLDDAVEEAYQRAGLDYRARYTPIVRTLIELGPSTLRTISNHIGISHSAVSQTVSQMASRQLVKVVAAQDGRERLVSLSPRAKTLLPELERCWRSTAKAAASIDAELSFPLSTLLDEALQALERRSFSVRLASVPRSD
jgi:DNA-binding MarR family transcriptional regulator